MSTFRSRLDRLEQSNAPTVWGRFITVWANDCDDHRARQYLGGQAVFLGPSDLLLVETHADPGSRSIMVDAPNSHHIIECTERFEDTLAHLD